MVWIARFIVLLLAVALLSACKSSGPSANTPVPSRADMEKQALASELLQQIPAGASLSIQPNLMAYLGTKGSPYLFPVVGDAEYVLADVASSQDPGVVKGLHRKVQELLDLGQFGVVDGADGLLLLKRGLAGQSLFPGRFYDFLRTRGDVSAFPNRIRFGDDLEMVAYDYDNTEGHLTRLVTYWRALRPLDADYNMLFLLNSSMGGNPEPYEDTSPAALWYPPKRWQSGELVRLEFAPVLISRDVSSVRLVVYRQSQPARQALPAVLADGTTFKDAVEVLDMARSPGEKISLAGHIGQPFEAPRPARQETALSEPPPSPAVSLCGKPLGDPSQARLRTVAIKIDNAPAAQPQVGLDQACIVYEHMAEGGVTRFTAIYQTEESEVGPVRSARRVDLHIVPQYQALFGHVGGAPAEMSLIKEYQLLDVDQFFHSEAYYYSRQRRAPHNVYTSVSAIRGTGERLGYGHEAELEGFPFADKAPQEGAPATEIIIPYSPSHTAEFQYDGQSGDYTRYTGGRPHVDASTGMVVRTKNIIVQHVRTWVASSSEDVNGADSYGMDLVGQGRATVFRDGKMIEGTWERPSLDGWTRFLDEAGQPVPLAPGKIWISLVTTDDQITVR